MESSSLVEFDMIIWGAYSNFSFSIPHYLHWPSTILQFGIPKVLLLLWICTNLAVISLTLLVFFFINLLLKP